MEIIKQNLVANIQNEEHLRQVLTMNTLENDDTDGNIVIEIIDNDRKSDVYAKFQIKVEISIEGNKRYIITKIVFEEKLSEELLSWIINMVLFALLPCNNFVRHYIIATTMFSYMLEFEKIDVVEKVKSEIIRKINTNIYHYIKEIFPNGI